MIFRAMQSIRLRFLSPGLLVLFAACAGEVAEIQETASAKKPHVTFTRQPSKLHISIGEQRFATYVYYDEEITRPYFTNVNTPSGVQATRTHPPIPGKDEMDHATFHPGIWMTFGDISGNDYWRLKARVEHEMFVEAPSGGPGQGSFVVRNYYMNEEGSDRVAAELAQYTIRVTPYGYLLLWESTLTPVTDRIVFGDQEEMGLGFRAGTPISVIYGGQIVDSEGRKNEEEIWGKQADWVDYSGQLEGQWVGLTLMPDPKNFRPSWFHARNYGLLLANPFGRKAMKAGPESHVVVNEGEELRLRFAILIHSSASSEQMDLDQAYEHFLTLLD